MKRILHIITFCMGLALFASCSDDLELKSNNDFGEPGLTLYLPDIESASYFGQTRTDDGVLTRATAEALESEASFNNLYLIAVNESGEVSRYELTTTSTSTPNSAYVPYTTRTKIAPGNYSLYVVANLDDYIAGGVESLDTKGKLEAAVLGFENNSGNPLLPGNLPMACLPKDIKTSATASSGVGSNFISISRDYSTEIWADLTFLCAKVRYTILFDNTPSTGFSYENFGNWTIDFTDQAGNTISTASSRGDHYATNINAETGLYEAGPFKAFSTSTNGYTLPLSKKNYPDNGASYPSYEGGTPQENLSGISSRDENKFAWQGTVYLPENTLASGNVTSLTFNGNLNGETKTYTISPVQGAGNDKTVLTRGRFYDISNLVKKLDNEMETSISVSDWTLQSLSYDLYGPSELTVESTSAPKAVSTGEWTSFWYESNIPASAISFDFPQLDNTDFLKAEVWQETDRMGNPIGYVFDEQGHNLIRVTINPAISYKVLKDLTEDQKSRLKYFTINAGNIKKVIKIELDNLDPYLNITPSIITLNVEEFISSGQHSANLEIAYETNVDDQDITISGATDIFSGLSMNNGNYALKITGSRLSDTGGWRILKGGSGQVNSGVLNLDIDDLFGGNPFWKEEKTVELSFSVAGVAETKTLQIVIKPYNTDYVIHFKDESGTWTAPHIYVYQALQLPVNLQGDNVYRAGYTVGYREKGTNGYSYNCALEYAFTNNISFKGWKGYGGPENSIYDPNQSYFYEASGNNYTNGFVIFQDRFGEDISSYNPKSRYLNGVECVYNFDVDFNAGHKVNKAYCYHCYYKAYRHHTCWSDMDPDDPASGASDTWKKDNFRLWPGIMMEEEGDGWWKYTLSGVATPGKAMIMFNDGHNDLKLNRRYPGDGQVGVPLFDFPDNEGWFLYTGSGEPVFSDDKPASTPAKPKYTYRFYWPADNNNNKMFFIANNNVYFDYGNNYMKYKDGWYYIEFITSDTSGDIQYRIDNLYYANGKPTDGGDITISGGLSKFSQPDSNGIRYAYVQNGDGFNIISGLPAESTTPSAFQPGDVMTLKWYEAGGRYYNHAYIFASDNYEPLGNWNTTAQDSNAIPFIDNNYYTKSFTFDRSKEEINIILYEGSNSNNRAEYNIKPSQVTMISGVGANNPQISYDKNTKTYFVEIRY